MIISSVNYSQNIGKADEWHLKDVYLGNLNLIVGKNAVGKSRTISIINALAMMLAGRVAQLYDGRWDIVLSDKKVVLRYTLVTDGRKVVEERLIKGRNILLKRYDEDGYYSVEGKKRQFNPPRDRLTVQVRRDKKELPYLEEIIGWAEGYHSFRFGSVRPDMLITRLGSLTNPNEHEPIIDDLGITPLYFEKNNAEVKQRIIDDLNNIGYQIEDIDVVSSLPNLPSQFAGVKLFSIKEKGVDFPIFQPAFSQGMLRAIAITVMMNHVLKEKGIGTIVIDDIGEGMDYERSTKLTKIIFKRAKDAGIQLIMASNDRFLMNTVDVKYWNVLDRKGKVVKAFNYTNCREAFDRFRMTGLNNFDFFAERMYRGLSNE